MELELTGGLATLQLIWILVFGIHLLKVQVVRKVIVTDVMVEVQVPLDLESIYKAVISGTARMLVLRPCLAGTVYLRRAGSASAAID